MKKLYLLEDNDTLLRYSVNYNERLITMYVNSLSVKLGAKIIDRVSVAELEKEYRSEIAKGIYRIGDEYTQNDGSSYFMLYYEEHDDIKNIISQVNKSKEDYLPEINELTRMKEYFKSISLLGEKTENYVNSKSIGNRLPLGEFSSYYGSELETNALNVISMIKYDEQEVVSLQELRKQIEENIGICYDLYKNGNLKYGLKDYQEIILSQVDRTFDEYRQEALDNTNVLAKAFIKNNQRNNY